MTTADDIERMADETDRRLREAHARRHRQDEIAALKVSIQSTLDHMTRLRDKRARLAAAQLDAERQVLARMASAHRDYLVTFEDLGDFYEQFRQIADVGFGARWDEVFKIPYATLRAWITNKRNPRWHPNGHGGSFFGEWPLTLNAPRPKVGRSVVYVLFDVQLMPCYVGSTKNFQYRLAAHQRDGKPFTRWVAYPCDDREAAYALEDKLLKEHRPYLNRKASR